jgi:hypothetical protein
MLKEKCIVLLLAGIIGMQPVHAQRKTLPQSRIPSAITRTTGAVLMNLPDLVVTDLRLGELLENGVALQVFDIVKNQGRGTAGPTSVVYYLFNVQTGGICQLGFRSVPALEPGQSSTASLYPPMYDVNPRQVTGDYQLIAVADGENVIAESNKGNNNMKYAGGMIHIRDISICPPFIPDFFIRPEDFVIELGNLRYTQSGNQVPDVLELARGSNLRVLADMMNIPYTCQGNYIDPANKKIEVEAGLLQFGNKTRIRLVVGFADGDGSFFSIPANERIIVRVSPQDDAFIIPLMHTIPPGDYWLYLQIDPDNKFYEVSESNNLILSKQIIRIQ